MNGYDDVEIAKPVTIDTLPESAVEQAHASDHDSSIENSSSLKKKHLWLLVAIATIAIAIGVGVGVPKGKKNSNNGNSITGDNNDAGTSLPEPAEPTDPADSDPIDVDPSLEGPVEDVVISTGDDTVTPISASRLFSVSLPPFSSDILTGYDSCSALVSDIEEAGKFLANSAIIQNMKYNSYYDDDGNFAGPMPVSIEGDMMEAADESSGSSANKGPPNPTESSFETNNQVDGVQEADIVKSDGTNVFAAYGNELVWLDRSGTVISRTEMPKIEFNVPDLGIWTEEGNNYDYIAVDMPYRGDWESQNINGLLLSENHIVAIVTAEIYSTNLKFLSSSTSVAHTFAMDGQNLVHLDAKEIKGGYRAARTVGSNMHIVTMANIETYRFSSVFSRWNFKGMDNETYAIAAKEKAVELIPLFARQLVAELIGDDSGAVDENSCGHIVRLSTMGADAEDDMRQEILNGFVQVTSFDVESKFLFSKKVSGAFIPVNYFDIHMTEEQLFLAGRGWKVTDDDNSWVDYTYLMGFDIYGAAAIPSTTGEVSGYLINQFAMDFYDGHLRVATTNSAKWGWIEEEKRWGQIIPTTNQMIVLKPSEKMLVETGSIEDIAEGESIFSVRFMSEKAFVVTFLQIDPFFTFDMSDPTDPKKVGELKIPGFSNYLHPVGDIYIMGIGQDVDPDSGRTLGLQITLFDVSDFANPKQVHKTVVDGWSYSESQNEHKAFRYLPESQILILPISKWSRFSSDPKDNFDGFYIYELDFDVGFTLLGSVTHADANLISRQCFNSAYLPSRSMVFEGQLMTFKGHTIEMADGLYTLANVWDIDLDENMTKEDICYPWFFW